MSAAFERVVIMVAMEEEAQYLYPMMDAGAETLPEAAGIVKSTRGTMHGMPVDIVVSGIGAVYAAMATTAALMQQRDTRSCIISCGCSGAHLCEQVAGDIVLGKSVVPLSAEVITRDGRPRLAGVRCSMLDAPTYGFEADAGLLGLAKEAALNLRDEGVITTEGGRRKPRIDVGVVGSSDVWRQSPAVIKQTNLLSGSCCEEMEAHAVAQVCHTFGVPFVAIKDVANSEIHPEEIQLEPTHSVVPDSVQVGLAAAQVTARTIGLMAKELPMVKESPGASRAGKRRNAAPAAAAGKRTAR